MSHGPLNPTLYARLQQLFGWVIIANEGSSMVSISRPDPFRPHRQIRDIISPGEYYRVWCEFCSDQRHRLWINHTYGQPNDRGYREAWMAVCFNENCINHPTRRLQLEEKIFGFRNRNQRVAPVAIRVGHMDCNALGKVLPPGAILPLNELPAYHPAVSYLVSRKYSVPDLVSQYRIGFCFSVEIPDYYPMRNRIYIPIVMNGDLVGWQGRFIGDADWRYVAKYYGRRGMRKNSMLYGYDVAKHWPFVVVVESATSVWRIGGPCVAVFGKTVSEQQRLLIQHTWPGKPIVLLLDPDARTEMDGVLHALISNARNPVVPLYLPPGRDPADYEQAEIWAMIQSSLHQAGLSMP